MLILASASKARRQLLENSAIPHKVIPSGINEDNFERSNPIELVNALAQAKAEAILPKVFESIENSQFRDPSKIKAILGCDSVFCFEGEILGKPKSSSEAIQRWGRMSNHNGILYTGHALIFDLTKSSNENKLNSNKIIRKCISTKISFSNITSSEIINYVATGEPMECAGGFSLEGRSGMFINNIQGCYSNVLGLSLPWLREALFELNFWD